MDQPSRMDEQLLYSTKKKGNRKRSIAARNDQRLCRKEYVDMEVGVKGALWQVRGIYTNRSK